MDFSCRREMGITHKEFFRLLPIALGGRSFESEGSVIKLKEASGSMLIELGEESSRSIASLKIPVTEVKLTFTGYDEETINAMLHRFERSYQRGGG